MLLLFHLWGSPPSLGKFCWWPSERDQWSKQIPLIIVYALWVFAWRRIVSWIWSWICMEVPQHNLFVNHSNINSNSNHIKAHHAQFMHSPSLLSYRCLLFTLQILPLDCLPYFSCMFIDWQISIFSNIVTAIFAVTFSPCWLTLSFTLSGVSSSSSFLTSYMVEVLEWSEQVWVWLFEKEWLISFLASFWLLLLSRSLMSIVCDLFLLSCCGEARLENLAGETGLDLMTDTLSVFYFIISLVSL